MASRHHLSDCEKDMVASVHSFFEEENQLGRRLSVRNVRRRTSLACGVSESEKNEKRSGHDSRSFLLPVFRKLEFARFQD